MVEISHWSLFLHEDSPQTMPRGIRFNDKNLVEIGQGQNRYRCHSLLKPLKCFLRPWCPAKLIPFKLLSKRPCQPTISYHKLPVIPDEAEKSSKFPERSRGGPLKHGSNLSSIDCHPFAGNDVAEVFKLLLAKQTLFVVSIQLMGSKGLQHKGQMVLVIGYV